MLAKIFVDLGIQRASLILLFALALGISSITKT
jgi:hypothetical protein